MNRVTRVLAGVLPGIAFTTPMFQSQAQTSECRADERQCLEDNLNLACGQDESLEQTCLAWIQRVETHGLAESPEWKLIAAVGYMRMAGLAESRDSSESYQEQSRSIYRQVLAGWPESQYSAQAYVGLSSMTDDIEESISLLHAAMRADPNNSNIAFLLAGTLQAHGRFDDLVQAADLYRKAYIARIATYYSAANALRLLALTGQAEQLAEFRAQVSADSGMANFADEVVLVQFAENAEHALHVLDTACHAYIVDIFGPETCANGIDTLVAATKSSASLQARQSLMDVATEGMRMLSVAETGLPEEERLRNLRFESFLQEWIDSGTATATVFVLWAQKQSDVNASVSAFERAVELDPSNGQYRYWMALGYMEQGRLDEAIENLTLARETLPDNVGLTPESVDVQIRKAEAEAETERGRRQQLP